MRGEEMKQLKKAGIVSLFLLCLLLIPAATAQAGFRKDAQTGKYRYYTSSNGKKYVVGKFKNIKSNGKTYTYYFDGSGYMVTGWKQIKAGDGKTYWYYFDRNGRMFKNRTKNGHYLKKNGRMLTCGTHNGIYYGADGSAVPGYQKKAKPGFKKTKKGIKYMQADGTYAQKKWVCVREKNGRSYWYYFYSTGYMAKNKWIGSRHVGKNGRLDKRKR